MNIFILDTDPQTCARYHNDTHVRKMLVESTQILCTVHHLTSNIENIPYKKTHPHHPCVKWALKSLSNYNWLCDLAGALALEYNYRTDKVHKSSTVYKWCYENKPNIPNIGLTNFTIGFNKEKYIDCIFEDDIVKSYRTYYQKYKQGYFRKGNFIPYKWTKRDKPKFMKSQLRGVHLDTVIIDDLKQ